jgi:hypothetical protein
MTLADIFEKLDELSERLSICERNIPKIHREILRNYTRAYYFGFISEGQYNKIKEDLELIKKYL